MLFFIILPELHISPHLIFWPFFYILSLEKYLEMLFCPCLSTFFHVSISLCHPGLKHSSSFVLISSQSASPIFSTKQKHIHFRKIRGSSHCGLVETNLTSIREDVGSIPCLAQWVGDPVWL